jgi:hypothetical protein
VIVNAVSSVDNNEFVYSVNGLRAAGSTGKALYRCRTDVGQKTVEQKKSDFHTLAPVDMQWFFHSRCDFFTFWVWQEGVWRHLVADGHVGSDGFACMLADLDGPCSWCCSLASIPVDKKTRAGR